MNKIPYFDGHCDTVMLCDMHSDWSLRENKGHLDLMRLKNTYSKAVQFFAMYYDLAKAPATGMMSVARRMQSVFAREIEKNSDIAVQCRNAEDIIKANAEGKVAAVLTCEGTEILNCDPDNLDWAKEVGIKAINLTHNHANFICGSHMSESERGLNELGKEFVRRAQANDILIDVSHCSDKAFWDLMDITTKPVIASHSDSRAICNHTRNVTDDMFRAIIKTGGVVGINFWIKFVSEKEDPSMDDVIRHIDHFMELGGEKNIGLGNDLDGCQKLAGGLKGVQDLPLLWDALAKRGYTEAQLNDIFYNNYLRVL